MYLDTYYKLYYYYNPKYKVSYKVKQILDI